MRLNRKMHLLENNLNEEMLKSLTAQWSDMTHSKRTDQSGFTMAELLAAVAITGTLSAIAIPAYTNQTHKIKQKQAEATMSQVMSAISVFNDEFGTSAKTWKDIDEVATIITPSGPAAADNLNPIILKQSGYTLWITNNGNNYKLRGYPPNKKEEQPEIVSYNILGCINTRNGSSDVATGNLSTPATWEQVKCQNA